MKDESNYKKKYYGYNTDIYRDKRLPLLQDKLEL